jgi:hypothetical protein
MIRRLIIGMVVAGLFLPLAATGCSDKKEGPITPTVKDKPPPDVPGPVQLGGPPGTPPGAGKTGKPVAGAE